MRMMTKRWVILSILALLTLGGTVLAQVSDNHDLSWHVLASGGREGMASGSYAVYGTLGQLTIGPAASGETAVGSGYWSGVGGTAGGPVSILYRIYLPLVYR
jgi:hypothetical protein